MNVNNLINFFCAYIIAWQSNSLRINASIYLNKWSVERDFYEGWEDAVFWNIFISMIMQSLSVKFHI